MSTSDENFLSLASKRMKEERQRLGLSQQAAADSCGVSREIWGKYERGTVVPGGDVLFSFAALGADVAYILTGKRQAPANLAEPAAGALAVSEPPGHYGAAVSLTSREAALLDNYRNSPEAGKDALDRTSAALAQSAALTAAKKST